MLNAAAPFFLSKFCLSLRQTGEDEHVPAAALQSEGVQDEVCVAPPETERELRDFQSTRGRAQYISTPEAAEYLGVSESYLNKARHFGRGPPFVRFGRSIRYSRGDLENLARQRAVLTHEKV